MNKHCVNKRVYNFRSPGEIKHDLNLDNDFYNLTMSYRLDSDISWNYGHTVDIETGNKIAPALDVHWREPDDDFNGKKIKKEILISVDF